MQIQLDINKQHALASIKQAEAIGIDLQRELFSFASNPEVLRRLNIVPAAEGAVGYYLVQYKSEYGLSYIRRLLETRAKGVKLVIFADGNQAEAIKSQFAAELRDAFRVLPLSQLESFIERIDDLPEAEKIHVKTDVSAALLKNKKQLSYATAALIGALGLAPGRIIVASDKPVAGARSELRIYEIITAAVEAARAYSRSA